MTFYEASRKDWNSIDYIQLDGINTIIIRNFKGRKNESFSIWYPMPQSWEFRKDFYDSLKPISQEDFIQEMRDAIYHIDFVYKTKNKILNYA